MWRDIFLANKDAVLEMLGRFSEDLSSRTRAIRRGIVDIGQDSPIPDFGRAHPNLPAEPLPRPYAADNE